MGFLELFLIGVGLSMDAFAVAVCKGLSMREIDKKGTLVIGLYFGFFQALMPLLGWAIGNRFAVYVNAVAHWITFGLLAFIGGGMIKEVLSGEEDAEEETAFRLDHKELFMLAIATSIDAFAVGVTFAFEGVNAWEAVGIIGVTTFFLSMIGVLVGNRFGHKYEAKAQLAGGIVLVLIGLKQVLSHFGLMPF